VVALLKGKVKTKIDIYSGEYEGVFEGEGDPLGVRLVWHGYADETIRFLETIAIKSDDTLAGENFQDFRPGPRSFFIFYVGRFN